MKERGAMTSRGHLLAALGLFLLGLLTRTKAEILTPPYFNLAEGRRISSTATCGEATAQPELYCKLVGANSDDDVNINIIQGQVCDYCDPSNPRLNHPPENAIDGSLKWWQSPPLSRGSKYNEVNLTIDLGQEFHVAYVFIRMANSPRPGVWALERSIDNGETYKPWQFFADTPSDCESYFGRESLQPITRDDSVICDTQFSKVVPLEGGEIVVSLVKNRPSANDFFNSTVLQEWSRATNIRLRLLRTKTLLGHLMSLQRQDPTVTRRYFYSIKDISIGGRCVCNGHASTCEYQEPGDELVPGDPYKLRCLCQHNTCGDQCEKCCPGFVQKAWRQSKSYKVFQCEPCNCFGHSDECIYDEEVDKNQESLDIHSRYDGGGVCQNCRDYTEGINCDRCMDGFYRPYGVLLNATDVCQPCDCDSFFSTGNCAEGSGQCECKPQFTPPNCDKCSFGYFDFPDCKPCECHINGTRGFQCEASGGQCPCKSNYAGTFCDVCAEGHYEFPECLDCECNAVGSLSTSCDLLTGQCTCRNNFGGRSCDTCQDGYFGYPDCQYCNCDVRGTEESVCDKESGKCLCREGYGGPRCDQCVAGYFGYPECKPCGCSEVGSASMVCDVTGKCPCLSNFAGRTCDQCSPGYYEFPECLACNCDNSGSIGISCGGDGKCQCKSNFDGVQCERCKEGFYNFPICEDCNCDPAGVIESFQGCGSVPAGELCQCKQRVTGRICNECRALFWNLNANNPAGCEECNCHVPGTVGGIGVCDSKTGQCVCKPSVTNRKCDMCADGTYNLLENNLHGCTDCGCDIGGAVNNVCDKGGAGQCLCRPRISGRTCNTPLQTHYFPTLYQAQYEAEDGRSPAGTAVRFRYDERDFPGFSWKGYAVFSLLQSEIVHDIYIQKPSLYRMVIRYVNRNEEPVIGVITIKPENPSSDVEQTFQVLLRPNAEPELVTVAGAAAAIPSPLVMNPGRWSVHTKIDRANVFIDYFVLLPLAFYEATILVENVETPCTMGKDDLCRHFQYPQVNRFDLVKGEGGFVSEGDVREQIREYFKDEQQLQILNADELPLINQNQPEIHFDMRLTKPGRHVLLINYFSPEPQLVPAVLHVETSTQKGRDKGRVNLYQCQFTNLCRQAVTDKHSKVAVFKFDTNFISLVLKGDNSTNVAIDSIIAIPFEKWSTDYIRPKSSCVKKDGQCILSTFPVPTYSTKVEFEDGNEQMIATELPEGIMDTDAKLVYIKDTMIDVRGQVPQEGPYAFIVHYYQPNYPEFTTDILVHNGQVYEAKLPVGHCPSVSGCRAVIRQLDSNPTFELTQNFQISVKEPPGKGMWIDYVLVVPAEHYNEGLLHEDPLDKTGEFISQCGKNNFHIDTQTEGFCRDAVFSLTSDFNNGALPCQCDFAGSLSFECDKFGGQCQCRENVIGRKCEACKTGFYGFPECRPCDCPSTAFCDPDSGACICPPRVTGEKCTECISQTYGFDSLIGCEECNCNPLGVLRGNLQCDLLTGLCDCKPNVVGRSCDHCKPGYWSFPYCHFCDCDLRGTTMEICDQFSAECHCKNNVQGSRCDYCKEGSFNLEDTNPDGCTQCFCFGRTSRCSSSSYYFVKEIQMDGWTLALVSYTPDVATTPMSTAPEFTRFTATADLTTEESLDRIVYFIAPLDYLGNKHTSYGGVLNYTITYESGIFGNAVSGPDVILRGAGFDLLHFSVEQPAATIPWLFSLPLVEQNFVLPSGLPVTREQMMQALHSLDGLYIRATYWEPSVNARVRNVTMQVGVDGETLISRALSPALSVEQCSCPPNYQGLSCEECAPGYYRSQAGSYGGFCVPCQCNGHADTCDVVTGICNNCKHNTTGDHCEKCEIGYHGDAQQGTPFDCLICACPLPVPSNNFAFGCEVSTDGDRISCDCMPGYYGARCESCAAGFFGNPDRLGEACQTCSCSGNINPEDPGSCDSHTGECLRCLNNTSGAACSLCAPGFYGDAVELKDCQYCDCDKCGTDHCNSYTGTCECMPNVIGDKCDRCEYNHWGFTSCQGCAACDCEEASLSNQCDDLTGQCMCKPGVGGRRCEKCAPGYWNYGPEGCATCGCNQNYSLGVGCNPNTGQCECLQGVIGEKCDHCPYRWVLKPDQGCFQCDSCTDDLLDVTDELRNLIDPVMTEFDTVALGYFTTQRLLYINDSVTELYPKVNLLDPESVDLKPLQTKLESVEQEGKTQKKRASYGSENGEKLDGDKVRRDALDVENLILQAVQDSQITVAEVSSLAYSLDQGSGSQIEPSLQEARAILTEIQGRDLSTPRNEAQEVLDKTTELLERMKEFALPVHNQSAAMEKLRGEITTFDDKLTDLRTHSVQVQNKADETTELHLVSKNAKLVNKVDTVKNISKKADRALNKTKEFLKNATDLLASSRAAFDKLSEAKDRGADSQFRLNTSITDTEQDLQEVGIPVNDAKEHAQTITDRAAELDNMLSDTRDLSRSAVEAASAYSNIVDAIEKAMQAAQDAGLVADNATSLSSGLNERTLESEERSRELLEKARKSLEVSHFELAPQLEEAEKLVEEIQNRNIQSDEGDRRINAALQQIPVKNLEPVTRDAMEMSEQADQAAQNALANIKNIVDQLPEQLVDAKQIPKDLADTTKKLAGAGTQVEKVNKIVPDMTNLMDNVKETQKRLNTLGKDVSAQLEELKKKVAQARDLANRVKVGVTFYPNTTLELKNPEGLPLLATSTQISTYFRTEKPNGFLFYLGNEIGTQQKQRRVMTDDFVALEIENGYPVLTIDLGSGAQRIVSDKYVSDGIWYQAVIDRTGKNAKLTIKEEGSEGRELVYKKEEALTGSKSILNLDQESSKLFVGGYPTSFNIQPAVKYSSFEGNMEELVIGGVPVGLWNFDDASNNGVGASERDRLVNLQPSTGFRFDGNGYAELESESFLRTDQLAVSFNFKTFVEDGLMFIVGANPSYVSSELRDGKVVTQINLGDGSSLVESAGKFNDGKWHSVDIRRSGRRAVIKIDSQIEGEVTAPGITDHIQANKIYFGGYPGNHKYPDVTNIDFDGCIDGVEFDTTPVDLGIDSKAFGVTAGCPVKVASIVSFEAPNPGFVRWPNATSDNFLELTLKLRTKARDGLVFYAESRDKLSTFSLALLDGALVLTSQRQQLITKGQYNDGDWHVITATHKSDALTIDIDDSDNYSSDSAPTLLSMLYGSMYFGGIPSNLTVTLGTVATQTPFLGCLGDATVNGVLINFANSTRRPNAILGQCQAKDQIGGVVPQKAYEPKAPGTPTKKPKQKTTTTPSPPEVEPPVPEVTDEPEVEVTTLPPPPTTTPAPVSQCVLPMYPAPEPEATEETGIRFGAAPWGRMEYNSLPNNYKKKYEFSIEFKTFVGDGIIFYVADNAHIDYIAVYLVDGQVFYGFNCGSGPLLLNSTGKYNDGRWHTVTFSRQQVNGKLNIDEIETKDGVSKGNTKSINVVTPFFVGGITEKVANFTKTNLKGINRTFEGCLRNFRMNDLPVVDLTVTAGTAPCSENVEPGVFFSADGGYLRTMEPFRVGFNIHIKLEIRPRNNSGILVSVHGRRDFLVIQLIDGAIKVTVDNGKGPISSKFQPSYPYYFCDGNWHSVEVIKAKTVVTLTIDRNEPLTEIGAPGTSSTDTNFPLYVGGHQSVTGRMRGFETTRRQFVGCIRNLVINDKPEKLSNFQAVGNVTRSSCPTK